MRNPVLVEVVRGDFVESVHRGSVVVLAGDGSVRAAVGSPDDPLLPRSAVKHAQAIASLDCGAAVSGELLALAASSHSGEPFHVEGVRSILASVGLTPAALQCPADLPSDETALAAWLAAGGRPEPILMNCSGKHAAMLAACVASGWPTDSYLDPAHPLQVHVREVISSLVRQPLRDPEVDGCGAPLFGMTLVGLARLEAAIATAPQGTHAYDVAQAVRTHPTYASGTHRDVATLMSRIPGLITKEGAEGVHVGALPDGRSFAIKIEDGSSRARTPVVVAVLNAMRLPAEQLSAVQDLATPVVLGGGKSVGELRVAVSLAQSLAH